MLRFAGDDAFERWLKSCPIDARALKYQVSRQGGVLGHVLRAIFGVPKACSDVAVNNRPRAQEV